MKVLMIAPEPFVEPRGTPISVHQRLLDLASLGHSVDLLTYHLGEDVDIPGVRIYRTPHVPFMKDVEIGPSWPKLFLDFLLLCRAIIMLCARRYDLIHSHEEAAFLASVLGVIFDTRHLYDMHSSLPRGLADFSFGNYFPIVKLFEVLEKWVINTCDAVITIDSDLEHRVREINPRVKQVTIEDLAVQMIGAHVDQRLINELKERFGQNGRLPIVYTGNFEHYQGLDLLLESAKIVRMHHPEVQFVLVGGKPRQVEHWREATKKRQLEDCVVFTGSVPVTEVSGYLELAEILVSPRTEATSVPMKIYSYLLSGKPIVATNLAPHTMVLNEATAVLVPPTKEAFAEGILKLIRDPDFGRRLGTQARDSAKREYGLDICRAKLDQIYRMLQSQTHAWECPFHASLEDQERV